jgi:hypothetical protein
MENITSGSILADEQIDCLYGSLRRLLHDQRSGIIRSVAGDAGFALDLIPDGITDGGTQRAPILSAIDGQWATFPSDRRERMLPRFAEALARQAGIEEVNTRILKCGFSFANGGLVPVIATGEIPT